MRSLQKCTELDDSSAYQPLLHWKNLGEKIPLPGIWKKYQWHMHKIMHLLYKKLKATLMSINRGLSYKLQTPVQKNIVQLENGITYESNN